MDKNFKVRLGVGIGMFAVALLGLYTFNSKPFKILFALFAVIAMIELLSFFRRKNSLVCMLLAIVEIGLLYFSILFVSKADLPHFWYVILGVPGYDIFAYLFGTLLGGKFFKKSRPFPHISKNKTWEGTILGLVVAETMVVILMTIRGAFSVDWMYLLCGPLALMGDLYESFLKRRFEVKDSNEILVRHSVFRWLELLVGGSKGHGGYLDRIDSVALAGAVLFVIISLV